MVTSAVARLSTTDESVDVRKILNDVESATTTLSRMGMVTI